MSAIISSLPGAEKYRQKQRTELVASTPDAKTRLGHEAKVSAAIVAQRGYKDYFSPILDTGGAELVLEDFFTFGFSSSASDRRAESVITRDINGGDFMKVAKTHAKSYKWLLESALHLLRAVDRLQRDDVNIVHFDIKAANIVWDEIRSRPVLVNFGASFFANDAAASEPFYAAEPGYGPWRVDIYLLASIPNTDAPCDVQILQNLCGEYIAKNWMFATETVVGEPARAAYVDMLHDWIESVKSLSWREVVAKLVAGWRAWDVYSACALFTYILVESGDSSVWTQTYRRELARGILAPLDAPVSAREIHANLFSKCRAYLSR